MDLKSLDRVDDSPPQTVIQCDFDGTVTLEDASFIMLDTFARGDWRKINREYEAGRITVGRFNEDAFALVKATRKALLASIKDKVRIRPGFVDFAAYCRSRQLRLVIVSNGLDFYIKAIMKNLGLTETEIHAARTVFHGDSLSVRYVGPDGRTLDDAFKEAYVTRYLNQSYRVVYVGNGTSDFPPARRCHHIFATGTLLKKCDEAGLTRTAFDDFFEVTRALEALVSRQ
jgi:2-hydroxy-3-keto-5-methylthiopentenyl-1-phosphate phosphatase